MGYSVTIHPAFPAGYSGPVDDGHGFEMELCPQMDMTEFMSFLAVAKFRSFSKASAHLGIPQPTLTAQVKRLEADLGRPLLDRRRLPVQLTPSGERLAEMMESTYDDVDRVLKRVSEGEIENSIVVASTPVVVTHILPAPVHAYLSSQPDARLQIRILTATEIMQCVVAGEVDFGILAANPKDKRFDFRPLHEYSWSAIAPVGAFRFKSRRPTISDLAEQPFVMPRKKASMIRNVLDDWFQRAGLTYKIALEVDNHDCVKRFVQSGLGISILPRYALDAADFEVLTVIDMGDLFPAEHVGIITVRGKRLPSLVNRFVSVLKAEIRPVEKPTGNGLRGRRTRTTSSRSTRAKLKAR